MIASLLMLMAADLPPFPPTDTTAFSPRYTEHMESLGRPMRLLSVPLFLPTGFSITNIVVANGFVTVQWQQGDPPFNVWGAPSPTGTWSVVASPVQGRSVTLAESTNHFFRIDQPPTNGLAIFTNTAVPYASNDVFWLSAWIDTRTFDSNACAVNEKCITEGTHKLLRFSVCVWNPSLTNWYGPTGNMFYFDPCHHHFHLTNATQFSLLGPEGTVANKKMGWCFRSFGKILDLGWNNDPPMTACYVPIMYPGWGDSYGAQDCMWIDINNVPDGQYTFRIELDPMKLYGFYDMAEHTIQIAGTNVFPLPP